jgi:hypothetical protein
MNGFLGDPIFALLLGQSGRQDERVPHGPATVTLLWPLPASSEFNLWNWIWLCLWQPLLPTRILAFQKFRDHL